MGILVSHKRDGCVRLARNFVDSGDQYWKTKAVEHEKHSEIFSRHQESAKHINANKKG